MPVLLSQLAPVAQHSGGLHALYVRMEPGVRMDGHRHDRPTIALVVSGDLSVAEKDKEHTESSGTLRLSRAGASHDVRSKHGANCLIISCHPSHAVARHALWDDVPASESTRFHVGSEAMHLVECVAAPETSVAEFETLCLALLTKVVRANEPASEPPRWLPRALDALTERAGRRGAGAEVARSLGIHPVHLARTVRRFTGLTLRDYVRRERIIRGSKLLRSSEHSLSRVAHEAGFADHSHFTREFVRRHGHTPSNDRHIPADVASVQAPEFPAVHLGRLTSQVNGGRGDTRWDGRDLLKG
jgi:AraC family transcriptional regulator